MQTRSATPRTARQIEAAFRTALAKGDVGITKRKKPPSFKAAMRALLIGRSREHETHPANDRRYKISRRMRRQEIGKPDFEASNAYRKQRITKNNAKLLKLANDLNEELNKCGKDTLSVATIRKAEAIEKLARNLKQEMTLTVRPD